MIWRHCLGRPKFAHGYNFYNVRYASGSRGEVVFFFSGNKLFLGSENDARSGAPGVFDLNDAGGLRLRRTETSEVSLLANEGE